MDRTLLYVFRPNEEPQAVYRYRLYDAKKYTEWTYAYDVIQDVWYVRDPKEPRWLFILDAGVPENYQLELLLLQAAHS